MTPRNNRQRATTQRRSGFSLIEVVVCSLLVSLVLLGAMEALGSSVAGRTHGANLARAQHFAQQLMAEIQSVSYHEPDGGLLDGLGLDGEVTSDRATFDDADDYAGWTESPLKARNGTVLSNTSGWRRSVLVDFVNPASPATVIATNQGVKRITVTVLYNGQTLARLVALRSDKYTP
jgi:prepilin-type N-terminal cleavage/methylation domain-containing protein